MCCCGLLRVQEVLLQQVTQQGDNLHFVALAAAQLEAAGEDIAKTLAQDLEVCVPWSTQSRAAATCCCDLTPAS